jgi:hypothetical protein
MPPYRIGVIGLGQRIAHVLAAMKEVGRRLEVTAYEDEGALLSDGPFEVGWNDPRLTPGDGFIGPPAPLGFATSTANTPGRNP